MATAARKISCAEGSFLNDDNECEKRREKQAGRQARHRRSPRAAIVRLGTQRTQARRAGVSRRSTVSSDLRAPCRRSGAGIGVPGRPLTGRERAVGCNGYDSIMSGVCPSRSPGDAVLHPPREYARRGWWARRGKLNASGASVDLRATDTCRERASLASVPHLLRGGRGEERAHWLSADQIALAAMLTISATSAVLNTNEMMPCTVAVRRMILSVMPTSETCAVMPITNEK